MSDYSEDGVERYRLKDCARNLRKQFGGDAIWHPIGPLVRQTLQKHHSDELKYIHLEDWDWHNIIDIENWPVRPLKRRSGPLRIGRHSRDNPMKWPEDREALMAAYPDRNGVEVHVLGGANAVVQKIGSLPQNWTVHPFGAMTPEAFLAEIDVFIYYTHSQWVESFGRAIIEAMAANVPVILPEVYKPLFGNAALYAPPREAVALARWLLENPSQAASQTEKAQAYVRTHFSYLAQIERLKKINIVDGIRQ
jgi:hypothetical protein